MTMPSSQYSSGPPNRSMGQRMSDARQRAKDTTGGRAAQVIGPHLEPGEQMQAGARVHTGPSDWMRWAPYVGRIVRLMQRHYYLMVTDRRLIFCGISYWSARPHHISWAVPRGGVQASDYTPGAIYPSFQLSFPDRKPMRLRIYSNYEPEAVQILNMIGMQMPSGQAPGGYQPHQGPPQGYQPQQAAPYQAPQQSYQPDPYNQPTQYQTPAPPSYQPTPPQYSDQQYQQPQQGGYPGEPYDDITRYTNPRQGPSGGPSGGRHRGPA